MSFLMHQGREGGVLGRGGGRCDDAGYARDVSACGDDTLMINLGPRLCAAAGGEIDGRGLVCIRQRSLTLTSTPQAAGRWQGR